MSDYVFGLVCIVAAVLSFCFGGFCLLLTLMTLFLGPEGPTCNVSAFTGSIAIYFGLFGLCVVAIGVVVARLAVKYLKRKNKTRV